MAERLSRKEKVMGPIPIVALRKLFIKKSRERVRKRKGKEREGKDKKIGREERTGYKKGRRFSSVAERLSRKEKVMGPIPIVALIF